MIAARNSWPAAERTNFEQADNGEPRTTQVLQLDTAEQAAEQFLPNRLPNIILSCSRNPGKPWAHARVTHFQRPTAVRLQVRLHGADPQPRLSFKQVSEWLVPWLDRAALTAEAAKSIDDGVDLVHDCVNDHRVIGTRDDRLQEIVERMRQAATISIRQTKNLIAGLPQLGSSPIDANRYSE